MSDEARTFSASERKKAAGTGAAMPGGGFPIKTAADLQNAIRAIGRAKDKAAAKAHIIKRAKALNLTSHLPNGWTTSDGAALGSERIDCPDCDRSFLTDTAFIDHADAVHTFSDIQMMVSEAINEKYASRTEDWKTSVYTYVVDIADDWVIFEASRGGQTDYYKASYSVLDNVATLGDPVEVRRRTVWDPVGDNEPAGVLSAGN